jgi:hypothetical protein
VCTCDDVLYLCAFTLDRHTICVAVVNRVREKEMQMANCKDSRGKFKVVERVRGSNPTARPRGRLDASKAHFFRMIMLMRSQHSGFGPLNWG